LPKDESAQREFWFWGIVSNILASNDGTIDVRLRLVYAEVAFRTLDKAAAMTPPSFVSVERDHAREKAKSLMELIHLSERDANPRQVDFQNE